jgi:hypothetical protein
LVEQGAKLILAGFLAFDCSLETSLDFFRAYFAGACFSFAFRPRKENIIDAQARAKYGKTGKAGEKVR